ncbi:hypothetical protein [Sporosarcina sp. SAFN-015]|uniref:hypothetical protein n=1 Tax=Sporosarcina sp. SAFN-015 TaxID=3387274 RepID=UPI003F7DA717
MDASGLALDARRLALNAQPPALDARRLALDVRPPALDARRLTLDAQPSALDIRPYIGVATIRGYRRKSVFTDLLDSPLGFYCYCQIRF